MKLSIQSAKLIAAVVVGLAFAGPAAAADPAGNKSSGPDTAADAQKPAGTSSKGMHSKAKNVANSEYKAAVAKCKTMDRADRRTCIKEAKAARKTAWSNAHPMGTSTKGYAGASGTAATPGTAADTKKQDDTFKKKPGG